MPPSSPLSKLEQFEEARGNLYSDVVRTYRQLQTDHLKLRQDSQAAIWELKVTQQRLEQLRDLHNKTESEWRERMYEWHGVIRENELSRLHGLRKDAEKKQLSNELEMLQSRYDLLREEHESVQRSRSQEHRKWMQQMDENKRRMDCFKRNQQILSSALTQAGVDIPSLENSSKATSSGHSPSFADGKSVQQKENATSSERDSIHKLELMPASDDTDKTAETDDPGAYVTHSQKSVNQIEIYTPKPVSQDRVILAPSSLQINSQSQGSQESIAQKESLAVQRVNKLKDDGALSRSDTTSPRPATRVRNTPGLRAESGPLANAITALEATQHKSDQYHPRSPREPRDMINDTPKPLLKAVQRVATPSRSTNMTTTPRGTRNTTPIPPDPSRWLGRGSTGGAGAPSKRHPFVRKDSFEDESANHSNHHHPSPRPDDVKIPQTPDMHDRTDHTTVHTIPRPEHARGKSVGALTTSKPPFLSRSPAAAAASPLLETPRVRASVSKKRKISSEHVKHETYSVSSDEEVKVEEASQQRRQEPSPPRQYMLNPDRNHGKTYQYHSVERKKEKRLCMHGEACDECERWYDMTADISNSPELRYGPTPSPPALHGPDVESDQERASKKQRLQNKVSRHKVEHEKNPTPPGYWEPGMPNTQTVQRQNAEADAMLLAKREKQRQEAAKENGKWKLVN